jgi:predicted ribosome quality control (RQC) complex YloA/Tae2 family protein
VGRNNTQNDELTCRIAAKTDIWLHTKDITGSHVIIRTNGGDVPMETIVYAAGLAAANSSAARSGNVPVDYTYVKYVKKPAGAKPGMVIFTNNKTLYVDPIKQ